MRCENFCPYCDNCPHAANMLCTAKIKRKEILRLEAPKYSDISEVQTELKEAFYTAMDSCDKRIHVIKAQTAIGKTHLYLEYLKNTDKPCIIAVPTNKLKNEVYRECINNGIDVRETPSIYEFEADIPKESFQYINKLYSTGNHAKVMQYIKSKSDSIPAFKSFISATEAAKKFEGHIITTHHKVLYSPEEWLRKYNLIIDEDILKTMTKNQITIELADIEELLDTDIPKKVRNHLNNIINTADEETLFTVAPLGDCKVEADFNLNALLNAKKFYSDGKVIIFYQTPELNNLKYTILSATADEYIYKQYFGEERVSFYMCNTAPYKGKLLQYVDHSYSRRYISNHDTVYKDIEQLIGNVPTITFKKYSDDADGIHFGNSEGCNCMKGQDIAVIGTPHVARFLYILLAYQMGYDGSRDEQRYQEVTYNGYKFWFYTFSNELLQRIHFWMIESELEQSVGRARLLREDCTVWLFSDFPLRQSEVVIGV